MDGLRETCCDGFWIMCFLHPEDNNRQTLLRLAEEWSGNSDADGHKDVGDVKRQQKDTL